MNKPISITTVNDYERLPKGQKKIVIDRDEDYNLRAVLHFGDLDFGASYYSAVAAVPAGSFVNYFEITGSDYKKHNLYTLENSYVNPPETRIDNVEGKFSGTAKLSFYGLKMKTDNTNEVVHLSEWCLNGPYNPIFSRMTKRKLTKAFAKERLESGGNIFESGKVFGETQNWARDYLRIKTDDLQFIIEKVPDDFGPSWSSNIGIEYRTTWEQGRIPNSAEREEILEICSFVLGRQLLPIGYTMYDKDENIIETYARNPWGNSAKSYCLKRGDEPPIEIFLPPFGRAETIISQLLPKYNELCRPFRLKEALWNCWVSRQMPLGTNLPILAAGVESMINGWFLNKSKSNVFLDKEKFESLLKEELGSIQNKLKEILDGDEIVANILRANQAGIMKSYQIFFDDIKLPINDKEWDAIDERHKFVHGKALFSEMDGRTLAQHALTFETLFNKIFLKLLGYSGTFIDYSTIGCPETQLA